MSEKTWFLKKCDLFERLTPQQADRLERHAVMRTFRKGAIIYFRTDPGQSVLLLTRGRVKIKDLTPDGKESILAFIDEGELFGELALVDSTARNEFAEAVEDSQVLVISREDLLWLIEQRSDVALKVTKLVGLRRQRIENRLRNILFRSNRERISSVLLELLQSHGERIGNRWEIRLRLSHQELASLIGATRESATLVLGHLQMEGLIEVRRRRIAVLDRDRLAAEVSGLTSAPVL